MCSLSKILIFSLSLAAVQPALAQSRTVNVVYDGVIQQGAAETLRVRDPISGQLTAAFDGTLPSNYPYQNGDRFSVAFTVDVPSEAELAARTGGTGQFRFPVVGTGTLGASFGNARNVDISGPASLVTRFPYNFNGLDLVFDGPTNQFYLDDRGGEWSFGAIDFPALQRTGPDGEVTVRGTSCFGIGCESPNLGGRFSGGNFRTTGIPLVELEAGTPVETRQGVFNIFASGLFSLPFLSTLGGGGGGGGGPVDVPAPSMLLLFGGAVGGLVMRRRKALKAA